MESSPHITPQKWKLLELLLREQGLNVLSLVPLLPRGETAPAPLSFAQQRLWFISQLMPGSSVYIVPEAVGLRGELNIAALEQSFNEILRRHEILRTRIETIRGEAVQVVEAELRLRVPVVDLGAVEEGMGEGEVKRLAREEAQREFDLSEVPLLRLTLVRMGSEDHVLLLTMHHVVTDGWSIGVFIRELGELYEGYSRGGQSRLEELAVQYADYAVWQRRWLEGEALERQLEYWKGQLRGVAPMLELPTDRGRPARRTLRCGRHAFALTREVSEGLSGLSRREGATLFMTLLAAFQTLLYRYAGQEDICIGSPIVNRNRKEVEPLIGYFVNMLLLRTDLGGNPSFRELVKRVREVTLGAYEHQDLPFEQLVDVLQPGRSLSYAPVVQVTFTLQNAPIEQLEFRKLTLRPMEVDSGDVEYDLSLIMSGDERGLAGLFVYSTDLFDSVTITQIASHLQTILEEVAADPDIRLLHIPLLKDQQEYAREFAFSSQISNDADLFTFERGTS